MIYFLLPHRGPKRFKYYVAGQNEIQRVKTRLISLEKKKSLIVWNIFPNRLQSYLINLNAIINHLIIYFIPSDRWRRYDNPKTELSYRIAESKSSKVTKLKN